jgi:hypothetical protein
MKVIKLNSSHIVATRPLFENNQYMGPTINASYFVNDNIDYCHESFYLVYLSDATNFHAYGVEDNAGNIIAMAAFYESVDDASWYIYDIRNLTNDNTVTKLLLDEIWMYNQQRGRLKSYTLWPAHDNSNHILSEWLGEKYGYFDECIVTAKHMCKIGLHWQILFNRTLMPIDTIVRCIFLKQEYRTVPFDAGGL